MGENAATRDSGLEASTAAWRRYLDRHATFSTEDRDTLEDRLREEVHALRASGLNGDEAFLIALKRLGEHHAGTREFAREHAAQLWEPRAEAGERGTPAGPNDALVAIGLGTLAAAAFKLPALAGVPFDDANAGWYARNFSLFVLPCLAAYFAWKRRLPVARWAPAAAAFALAAVLVNVLGFQPDSMSETLAALHLPIALWFAIGYVHADGRWRSAARRMEFVRFSGEMFIHYVLIALGGGVLTGLTIAMFEAVGLNAGPLAAAWILPCGALGAVLVAAWLVEAKPGAAANLAPMLTRIFTPLFAAALAAFLAAIAWTGNAIDVEREILIAFDLLLVVVAGMLLYSVSARDAASRPSAFDALQLALILAALAADAMALTAIWARIAEYGASPNKAAALGLNVILLASLAGSAWLQARFLAGRAGFDRVARWQTAYLPAYAAWAAIVVIVFPLVFGGR